MTEKDEPGSIQERLGEHLRSCRLAASMTQAQVAEKAALAEETVSRLESGRMNPSLDVLVRLAAAMSVRVTDFFREAVVIDPKEKDQMIEVITKRLKKMRRDEVALIFDIISTLTRQVSSIYEHPPEIPRRKV